jgi:methylphosphotriester-DNA--protein-cysteine methyltransferase
MKFDQYAPSEKLKEYIKYFVVSENKTESEYKVFPTTGLVIGFQYTGQLQTVQNNAIQTLSSAGITGMMDGYKIFKNSASIGTVLVYFTEIGFTHFSSHPANELFNLSLSLDEIFEKNSVKAVEEKLGMATSDSQRIKIVEQYLITQLKEIQKDPLIVAAIQIIYQRKGNISVKELYENLWISQSPFEKRFRKVVGITPKKFISIIRFQAVLDSMKTPKSLSEICYEHHFFDPAHFSKVFKQFTGDTPDKYKSFK